MQSILVKDHMNSQPLTFSPDDDAREAVSRLITNKITGAPVVDSQGMLVGFLSEQDCIKEMLNDAFYHQEAVRVGSLMQPKVISITANTGIVEVAQIMVTHKPKNYPVVADGKLVGVITRRDVLQALLDYDAETYQQKRA